MPKVLYADPKKCIACRACEVACEREHHGTSNVRVTRLEGSGASPVSCRHCLNSPCAAVCPHQALALSPIGIMVLDRERCTNCGLCVFACPFGAIDRTPGGIVKCDLCMHRLAKGNKPACATTCPMGAIVYGECSDVSGEARLRRASLLAEGMPPGR